MPSSIFDSHAHYDDKSFDSDRDTLLEELPNRGICNLINCGADLSSSRASVELAGKYPYIYAAVGIHPECAKDAPADYLQQMEELVTKEKVVAVGEIGLDYHFEENAPKNVQKVLFENQILLAQKAGLPIIVHDRDAHGDTMELLRKRKPKGVVHCFSGSVEMAEECIRLGLYIGLGGAVTFKNARVPVAVAAAIPLDRMLMETDCPYMAPVPFRGKRNDSTLIAYTAARIAEIRGTTAGEILRASRRNAETLFKIHS
ncbi:TatD family hydrolase [Caproiciproducens galactitolivorans]|uniref:TatD family hydrolase n=1 Tax=Caproiciproducens galactitolivorans TaxID=642589 RepID=A0ABT4BU36_9FIRM|nr:TatD family hydrolase [Caproiciproducens galactitolivorans]MCY1714412.1 TatD family hydrolase [Caproiciproducens galactitolivorans]